MYDYNKKDYRIRDSMLNRTTSLDDGNRYDILYFDGLKAETLEKLIEMGFADPQDSQNNAPNIATILEFLKRNPSFTAHGYAVTPHRSDYRISLEGVEANFADDSEVAEFIELFRHADDFKSAADYQYAWFD